MIQEHAWSDDGRLTLRGIYPASVEGSFETVLRRRSSTEQHVVAFDRDGDTFTITIDVDPRCRRSGGCCRCATEAGRSSCAGPEPVTPG